MNVYQKVNSHCHELVADVLVLNHEQRQKGRLKVQTQAGAEVRLFLERGKSLVPGELLQTECGQILQVEAAHEDVMIARSDDWLTFSRACYHLGNRHVKIEVNALELKITPDYVLQAMLEQLGLEVETCRAVFVPESGAYSVGVGGHGHHH